MKELLRILPLLLLLASSSDVYGEVIGNISVVRGTNANSGSNIVSITATAAPLTNVLVESSSDLTNWGPASLLLTSSTNLTNNVQWQTKECVGLKQRFYRVVKPHASYTESGPAGRLTQPTPGGTFFLTTAGGWSISLDKTNGLRCIHPNTNYWFDYWGAAHENLKGKHIKDLLGSRRTYILTDNTIITLHVDLTLPVTFPLSQMTFISIYDGDQTHRINVQNFTLERSCGIARYGEADEYDGETARFIDNVTGPRMENIYEEPNPCSGASQKIFNTVPLGQMFWDNLNRIDDYFDDPRYGHT